jgi:hypothetical protein
MSCCCGYDGLIECRECRQKREDGEEESRIASEKGERPTHDITNLYGCSWPASERIIKYIHELEVRLGIRPETPLGPVCNCSEECDEWYLHESYCPIYLEGKG